MFKIIKSNLVKIKFRNKKTWSLKIQVLKKDVLIILLS